MTANRRRPPANAPDLAAALVVAALEDAAAADRRAARRRRRLELEDEAFAADRRLRIAALEDQYRRLTDGDAT